MIAHSRLRLVIDQWRGIDPDHGEFHVVAYSDGSQWARFRSIDSDVFGPEVELRATGGAS